MTTALLLGEAPGDKRPGNEELLPLRGLAQRLVRWAGFPVDEALAEPDRSYVALLARFTCRNVFERREAAYPWRLTTARRVMTHYLETHPHPPGVIVCLGRKAGDSVGLGADVSWGRWTKRDERLISMIPHPSGLCRLYNEESMRELAGRVLVEAVELSRAEVVA